MLGLHIFNRSSVIRLAPYIAQRAPLSRRQAEQAIKIGRISIDGVVCTEFYSPPFETIALDGENLLVPPPPKMWIYYKPVGELVTRFDPQGRPTVFDAVRPLLPQGPLVCVGRLDYESEGLLLLTNAPSVAHSLEKGRMNRCYRVWLRGQLTSDRIKALENGITIEDIYYRPCRIMIERQSEGCSQVLVTLTEGKKREIRVLMSAVNQHVTRLMRISFGPFRLGGLTAGHVIPVADEAVKSFLTSVEEEKKRISKKQSEIISRQKERGSKDRSVLSVRSGRDSNAGGLPTSNPVSDRWEKRAPKDREPTTEPGNFASKSFSSSYGTRPPRPVSSSGSSSYGARPSRPVSSSGSSELRAPNSRPLSRPAGSSWGSKTGPSSSSSFAQRPGAPSYGSRPPRPASSGSSSYGARPARPVSSGSSSYGTRPPRPVSSGSSELRASTSRPLSRPAGSSWGSKTGPSSSSSFAQRPGSSSYGARPPRPVSSGSSSYGTRNPRPVSSGSSSYGARPQRPVSSSGSSELRSSNSRAFDLSSPFKNRSISKPKTPRPTLHLND